MDASSSTSSSSVRGFPWAALVAVLLIVAGEVGIWRHREIFSWSLVQTLADKRQLLHDGRSDDIVIAGDSRLFHMKPDVVSAAIGPGLHATNYSWPFFGAEAYIYFLNGYLSLKPAPRLIVCNFPVSFFGQPVKDIYRCENPLVTLRMYFLLPPVPLLKDLAHDHAWGVFWDYLKFLASPPSLKYRDRLCKHLRLLRDEGHIDNFDAEDKRRVEEFRREGSFRIYTHQRFDPVKDLQDFVKFYGPIQPNNAPEVPAAFERFLDRTEALGIPVVLMNSPDSQALHELWERTGVLAPFDATVARWKARYKHLVVLEPPAPSSANNEFGDPAHVNAEGEDVHRPAYTGQLLMHREEINRLMDAAKR